MAKVALVRNKVRKEIPLGLIVLKSFLDQTRHISWIHDMVLETNTLESLEDLIVREDIRIVGISSGSITFKEDTQLIKDLKKKYRATVIVGGVFASISGLFDKEADYVVTGRGTEKLLGILDDIDGIKSSLPIERINPDLIDFQDYEYPRDIAGNREFPLYTSMGCKFGCLFCSIPQANNWQVWYKDPFIVAQEIKDLVSKGIQYLRFVDDLFGQDRLKTKELLDLLKTIPEIKSIYTQLRIDHTTQELLEEMKKAKFSGIYYGIESASEDTLRKIGKPYKRKRVLEILRLSRDLGFKLTGSFSIGYPWEAEEDIIQTLDFVRELKHRFDLRPSIYIIAPFPNTPLFEQVDKRRIRIRDYTVWDAKHAVMDTEHVQYERVQELYDSFHTNNDK